MIHISHVVSASDNTIYQRIQTELDILSAHTHARTHAMHVRATKTTARLGANTVEIEREWNTNAQGTIERATWQEKNGNKLKS